MQHYGPRPFNINKNFSMYTANSKTVFIIICVHCMQLFRYTKNLTHNTKQTPCNGSKNISLMGQFAYGNSIEFTSGMNRCFEKIFTAEVRRRDCSSPFAYFMVICRTRRRICVLCKKSTEMTNTYLVQINLFWGVELSSRGSLGGVSAKCRQKRQISNITCLYDL
jgi:hypothetical protein